MFRRAHLLVACCLAAVAGCDLFLPPPPEVASEEPPSPFAHKIECQRLYNGGHVSRALACLRDEIAAPSFPGTKSQTATLIHAIQVLGDLAELPTAEADLLAEGTRYHAEALRLLRQQYDELTPNYATAAEGYQRAMGAQLDYAWGVLNVRAGRPQEALSALRRAQAAWQAGAEKHPFDAIRVIGELAAAHRALGHRALAEQLEATALQRALAHLAEPYGYEYSYLVSWLGGNQRMSELWFLLRSFERHGASRDENRMRTSSSAQSALLREVEPTANLEAIFAARTSAAYVRAGNLEAARGALAWARQRRDAAAVEEPDDLDRDHVFAVTEAELAMAEGHPEQAVAALSPVVAAAEQRGARVAPSLQTLFGLSLEATGDLEAAGRELEAAVTAFERARAGIAVADRSSFFGRDERAAYRGVVRISARRAAASQEAGDFFEALRASERIRARQLGERLVQRGFELGAIDGLDDLLRGIDEKEAWLDYVVTESGTVLLALAKQGHVAALLPLRADSLAERVDRIRALTISPPRGRDGKARDREIEALSRDLLAPAAALLRGKTRWVVLPDGALSAMPLDLLLAPGGGPVLEGVEVIVAPSISLLHAKPATTLASAGLFAVGDPLYAEASPLSTAERGAFSARIAPLPETRSEVARIASLFPAETVTTLFADRATESAVRKAELRRYRILHFATHGVLGGQLPELNEPALVMAREPGEDGFLTASEVERLDLSAEVAVLSACDTGRGEYVVGEGVLGLGRAFMVAGARSVVISLWPVDSFATEELMVSFYRHLQATERVGEALRLAKLEMRAGKLGAAGGRRALTLDAGTAAKPVDRSDPYYWAGFAVMSR